MDEDGEDDYMSDKFIVSAASEQSTLLTSKASKEIERENRIKEKQRRNQKKPIKVLEQEGREEKLNTPLDESNKGFAMLAKMGFKAGMGLGKNECGRSEPIPLNIKTGRGGIGKESHSKFEKTKRIKDRVHLLERKRRQTEELKGDFQTRMKRRFASRQIEADLARSQVACEQLDSAKDMECVQSWYWRRTVKEPETVDESEDAEAGEAEEEEEEKAEEKAELEALDKLHAVTSYLRSTHHYCVWCGTAYEDDTDIASNCPGDTFEDHNE